METLSTRRQSARSSVWHIPAEGRREQDIVSAALFAVVAAVIVFATLFFMAYTASEQLLGSVISGDPMSEASSDDQNASGNKSAPGSRKVPPPRGGSTGRSAVDALRRCTAEGRILDLTRGEPGAPHCAEECVEPSIRTVQSEGIAFCLLPVLRDAPLDISFTLALRGVNWRQIPSIEVVRMHLPLAAGQALQVAPGDMMGEMMVRDADLYDGFDLAAFELHRIGGEVGNVKKPSEAPASVKVTTRSPEPTDILSVRPDMLEQASKGDVPIKDSLETLLSPGQPPSNTSGRKSDRSRSSPASSSSLKSNVGAIGGGGGGASNLRGGAVMHGFGPVGMPCQHCDIYVAMRCEAWRISSNNSAEEPNPLLRALVGHNLDELQHLLGLPSGWQVLQYNAVPQSRGLVPIEVAGIEPAFRFNGYGWGEDPVLANLTGGRGGYGQYDGNPYGARGDGLPTPGDLLGMEMFLFAFLVVGVGFMLAWQALGSGFRNEFRSFDRHPAGLGLDGGSFAQRTSTRRALGGKISGASSRQAALGW